MSSLNVHICHELDSEVIASLSQGERVHVLDLMETDGGLKRVLVVRKGETSPLGWISVAREDGRLVLRPTNARPCFEVVRPPIVRKRFEMTSEVVCTLEVGTRLYVLEQRRTSKGDQRVCIVLEEDVLTSHQPLGWITARKPEAGATFIRPLAENEDEEQPRAANAEAVAVAVPPWLRSPSASTPRLRVTPRCWSEDTKTPRPRWSREYGGILVKVAGDDALMGNNATMEDNGQTRFSTTGTGGTHPQVPKEEAGSTNGGSLSLRGSMLVASFGQRLRRNSQKNPPKLKSSAALKAVYDDYIARAKAKEALLESSNRSIAVQLGDVLVSKKIKVNELVKAWAKRGEEPISKMEFRQHVRKMLEKVDAKDTDALFESLDEDHGGTLDVSEIKHALKKLQDSSAAAKANERALVAEASVLRERAASCMKAVEVTKVAEKAERTIEEQTQFENRPISVRLGKLLTSSHIKVADIVVKWGGRDGLVDPVEFRTNVKGLGLTATNDEIDGLFKSLDKDGGGKLDIDEIKAALRKLQEDAVSDQQTLKKLSHSLADLQNAARKGQCDWDHIVYVDEQATKAQAEQLAREEEERMAAAAEAKAAKAKAAAEKKAAEAAEKAAFDAKVKERQAASGGGSFKRRGSVVEA